MAVKAPYRDQRGDGRDQEEPGQEPSLNIPLQEAGEIIEHIGRKRKCTAVDVRLVLTCCQDSYDRNESFKDDRDDEHRATEGRDEARAFHKIPYPSAMHSDPLGPDFFRC